MSITFPNGLPGIVKTYGNPFEYIEAKAAWEHVALEVRKLPFSIPYAYGKHITVGQVRAHRLVVDAIVEGIVKSREAGVPVERLVYGGCYVFRGKRGASGELSTHAWGIAIDLDPVNNRRGRPWDCGRLGLHPAIIGVFEHLGFTWGGPWPTPDPMHFQAASGY